MTWKSVAIDSQQVERPRRPRVVEGHERVVEDQRRPPVAGHQPDEPEPGDEVDEVERALAERRDGDPVALLRGVDLDVERLVVDPDAPVAAAGHRRQVADHVRLEVAGRGLHRRLLGAVDRGERRREDALAALERGQLLAPGGQPLGLPGDLLGVDGVRLDPGAGVRLVVAGALERALLVADLDLEPLAGARLLGDRPERLEGAGLLLDLERGGVALGSAASRAAPCRRGPRAGPSAGRSGRRAPPRARAGPRPRRGRPARAPRAAPSASPRSP